MPTAANTLTREKPATKTRIKTAPHAQTGADMVVRTLEAHGVRHIFGVPGAKIDAVFNSLVDSKIKTVACRHEQNAAFMAGGIGRMTGKAGVCIGTSGPGVSNLVTGLATANTEGDPLVALGGAVARDEALKKVHQTMDSVSICKPVTKFSATVDSPHAVVEVLSNAFHASECGRPGASFVGLPQDIMVAPAQAKILTLPNFTGLGPANSEGIGNAARLISVAEPPVVLLGMLASKPANAAVLGEFLHRNNLPVVGTFQATGAAAAAYKLDNFGGRVGQIANQPADQLLDAADVVITVGYDPVEYWPDLWNKSKDREIIHVDVQRADIDTWYCPSVELIGDIAQTLSALTPLIKRGKKSALSTSILQAIQAERAQLREEASRLNGMPVHPLRLVYELQKFLDTDVTVCLDMGSFHLWIARHFYSFKMRQLLISNGQQTLGVALPWAIAATIVRPGENGGPLRSSEV